jgi:hypothetical protein
LPSFWIILNFIFIIILDVILNFILIIINAILNFMPSFLLPCNIGTYAYAANSSAPKGCGSPARALLPHFVNWRNNALPHHWSLRHFIMPAAIFCSDM